MALASTEELSSVLLHKKINTIGLFTVNSDSYSFLSESCFVVDGGISLYGDDFVFSITWNQEQELFDTSFGRAEKLLDGIEFYTLKHNEELLRRVHGNIITNIETRFTWYYDLNDDMEMIEPKHYIIEQLLLTLDNAITLQIATVEYEVRNNAISKAVFNPQGELLCSINTIIQISEAE